MKIVFICGTIEPGKDGVGDYTRLLCAQLMQRGISASILAYNDRFQTENKTETQLVGDIKIDCMRLSYLSSSKNKVIKAKEFISSKHPDWISLQFVPYSFHPKGLPIGLAREIKFIVGDVKLQIMIHELWIGMSENASIKEKFIGRLQKQIIKRIFATLKPEIINTQTDLYRFQIKSMGFDNSLLPIFSNIPVLKSENISIPDFNTDSNYFVIFGSIHHNAPIEVFVKELREVEDNNITTFVAIGSNGSEIESWSKVIKKYNLNIKILGRQSEANVSYVLKHAKFGISTTPISLVQKSGSVAAMLEHNLNVICFSRLWVPKGYSLEDNLQGIYHYTQGSLKEILNVKRAQANGEIHLSSVTEKFLDNLKSV